jgi:intracellular septation protein A
MGRSLAWGLAAPVAGYYLLRAAGIDARLALIAGAAASVLGLAVHLLRGRRLDDLGAMFAVLTLLALALTLVNGSPRFLLAKDGLLTAASGLWFLGSVRWGARPAGLTFGRPLMEPMTRGHDWDELWDTVPMFRRAWRVVTVIWGVTLLADAVVRVVTAYTLPVDVVPVFNGALWAALFVALQIVGNVYFHRAGLFRLLFHHDHAPRRRP